MKRVKACFVTYNYVYTEVPDEIVDEPYEEDIEGYILDRFPEKDLGDLCYIDLIDTNERIWD